MNQLSRISPISDLEAARTVRPGTLADLAAQITATPAMADLAGAGIRQSARNGQGAGSRRRLALTGIAAAVVAGLAAAGFIAVPNQPAQVTPAHPSQPVSG